MAFSIFGAKSQLTNNKWRMVVVEEYASHVYCSVGH